MSGRIQTDITLKKLKGQYGKKPFVQKIVYMNLLAELTQMLRLHGLYPIPGPQMAKLAPDMEIGHLHIVEKRKDQCVKEDWVSLRSCIERSKLAKFGTLMKRHILPTKAMGQNGKVPSLLELYLTLYTVYLSEARLSITKENPIFSIGNYCGVGTTVAHPLDNLFFKQPNHDSTKLSNMKQLCIVDQTNDPSQLTTIALMLFKVVNTPLKASSLIQEKFNCINSRKDDETMPFMQVDRTNITSLAQKKNKVANITSLAQKKSKVVTTTKPDDNVSKPNEKVPKPGSSPQAPEPPLSNVDRTVTTNVVRKFTTTTVVTSAVGGRVRVPLAKSNNKIPQPTVLHPKSTKQSDKAHTVPSTPVLSEPSVANMTVRVLVHSLEEFIASCSASKDSNVSVRLKDAQKVILTFIGVVTTDKFETWELLSEACKGRTPVQIGQMPTDVLTSTHPSMTRQQIVSSLLSHKGQYDDGEDMTFDITPNRGEVYKALGVSIYSSTLDPNSVRYKGKFIFFNITNYKVLWDILHDVPTQHIDRSTNELVRLLKEAELGGWILSPRVKEERGRSNLVVIVKYSAYCNIKNTYQPRGGFKSFASDNDETESMPSERDDADPNKNDKGDSRDNNTTNNVICSDSEQGGSELTKDESDGSVDKEDGIAYKEDVDSGNGGVQTTDARQDNMQDDSGKKLVTDEASKKRKTTGLNHSESGKTSEDKKDDIDESKKRRKSKGKVETVNSEQWTSPRKNKPKVGSYKV